MGSGKGPVRRPYGRWFCRIILPGREENLRSFRLFFNGLREKKRFRNQDVVVFVENPQDLAGRLDLGRLCGKIEM